SWQHMGLDSTGRIARIVIDPANPDVVLVCALGRAYGPEQQRGVYRTADGGRTWARVLFVDPNTGCSDLAIDPGDPNTLFAGMWQFEVKTWHLQSGGPGSGLWASRDGGVTWKRLVGHGLPDAKHNVGKVAVAVAPSNPNTVYALVEDRDPTLYRSDDRGNFWRVVSRNTTWPSARRITCASRSRPTMRSGSTSCRCDSACRATAARHSGAPASRPAATTTICGSIP